MRRGSAWVHMWTRNWTDYDATVETVADLDRQPSLDKEGSEVCTQGRRLSMRGGLPFDEECVGVVHGMSLTAEDGVTLKLCTKADKSYIFLFI